MFVKSVQSQIREPKEDVEYALRRFVIPPLRQVDRCNCLRGGMQSGGFKLEAGMMLARIQ